MNQYIQWLSHSVEQTMAIAQGVVGCAREGDVIALIGQLGAGKTAFVRGMAGGLGIATNMVSSPTFVIMHEYQAAAVNDGEAVGPVLVHIDAYRLHGPDELASIGWESDGEELRQGAIVAIEWADRIRDCSGNISGNALGASFLEVQMEHAEDGRRISLLPHGSWTERMGKLRIENDELIITN